jgi:hypothetical protein
MTSIEMRMFGFYSSCLIPVLEGPPIPKLLRFIVLKHAKILVEMQSDYHQETDVHLLLP